MQKPNGIIYLPQTMHACQPLTKTGTEYADAFGAGNTLIIAGTNICYSFYLIAKTHF